MSNSNHIKLDDYVVTFTSDVSVGFYYSNSGSIRMTAGVEDGVLHCINSWPLPGDAPMGLAADVLCGIRIRVHPNAHQFAVVGSVFDTFSHANISTISKCPTCVLLRFSELAEGQ